jgi:hypothetical protein
MGNQGGGVWKWEILTQGIGRARDRRVENQHAPRREPRGLTGGGLLCRQVISGGVPGFVEPFPRLPESLKQRAVL